MNEKQRLVFDKGRILHAENEITPNFWLYRSIRFAMPKNSSDILIEQFQAVGSFLIEKMRKETDKIVLKKIDCFSLRRFKQDGSEERGTTLDCRVAIHNYKNVKLATERKR